jgi:hypothetical protein
MGEYEYAQRSQTRRNHFVEGAIENKEARSLMLEYQPHAKRK